MINLEEGKAFLDYEKVKKIYENKGAEYFLKLFERIFKKGLYSFSLYWLENSMYVIKFKGAYGDVIIDWKEI